MPTLITLKKINAISGLSFGCFLMMHLVTHYALVFGLITANSTMAALRKIYQNFVSEILLAMSFVAHLYANAGLYAARAKLQKNKKDDGDNEKEKDNKPAPGAGELFAHRLAGYILAFFIFGHVFAVRIAPLLYMENASFYDYSFVGKAYELLPFNIFPIYYCILGVAGGWHLIYGVHSAITVLFWGGSVIVARPLPMFLKVLALANHVMIIWAIISLGRYMANLDMSDREDMHADFFRAMGMTD